MELGGNKIVRVVAGLANGVIDQFIIVFGIRVERFVHARSIIENDTGLYIGP